MDASAYERWSEALEQSIVQRKRGSRETIFRNSIATGGAALENLFLPAHGFTVGQLAYYIYVQTKKPQ